MPLKIGAWCLTSAKRRQSPNSPMFGLSAPYYAYNGTDGSKKSSEKRSDLLPHIYVHTDDGLKPADVPALRQLGGQGLLYGIKDSKSDQELENTFFYPKVRAGHQVRHRWTLFAWTISSCGCPLADPQEPVYCRLEPPAEAAAANQEELQALQAVR
jgi:hypothetical protein